MRSPNSGRLKVGWSYSLNCKNAARLLSTCIYKPLNYVKEQIGLWYWNIHPGAYLRPRNKILLPLKHSIYYNVLLTLTFSNTLFCPHGACMSIVWVSEHIAIISLNRKKQLIVVMQTPVFLEVRADFKYYGDELRASKV